MLWALWHALNFCRRHAAHTTLCCVALALLIRVSIRDQIPGISAIYYATPLIICAVAALGAAIAHAVHRRPIPATASLIVSTILALVWYNTHTVRTPHADRRGSLRVMFWNVARVTENFDGLQQVLADHDPHIMALVESSGLQKKPKTFFAARFPGYRIQRMDGGISLLAKGSITPEPYDKIGPHTGMVLFHVGLNDGRDVHVLVVDFVSWPLVDRRPFLDAVYQKATQPGQPPTIIMGDFNTPHDSVFFAPFAENYHHAFMRAGNGLISTWPAVCPILALDHAWIPKSYTVLRSWLRRTRSSDHKLIIVDLDDASSSSLPSVEGKPLE